MIGRDIGPYRVLERVGAGGMGEVYRARDARLGRDVAVKVLPADGVTSPDRARRFVQEARSASALNHPNIISIHDIGEHEGGTYLVMELVAGRPLSALVAAGALPLDRALDYASQMAAALTAAHEAGIVHRDVKPANVMVADSGTVKVLDFGLAKSAADLGAAGATQTGDVATASGAILGTIGYMSPEQAQGQRVDARTDIFAFGAVLYEMVTGRRAFTRDSAASTLAAILKEEPTPSREIVPGLPPSLERLIARCLRKDPRQRFQHMRDVALLIEDLREELAHPVPGQVAAGSAGPVARTSRVALAGTALACLLLGGGAAWLAVGRVAPAPGVIRRFEIPIKATPSELSLGQGLAGPALSPDGSMLAYVEGGVLRVRDLDETTPRDLATGVEGPFWSPDSREIGFVSDGVLRRVPATGGPPVAVCEADISGVLLGGAWSDDGRIVLSFSGRDLFEVPARGGTLQPLVVADRAKNEFDFHDPVFLPGGKGILASLHTIEGANMRLVLLTGTERRFLLDDAAGDTRTPVYARSGHVLYTRQRGTLALYALPFSLDRLEVTGPPVHLADHATAPTVSADQTLAYRTGTWAMPVDMVVLDRSGQILGSSSEPAAEIRVPSVSPSGDRVAFMAYETANGDIRVRDLEGGMETRVSQAFRMNASPAWSPDGTRLAYTEGSLVANRVVVARADGSGDPRPLAECARPCRSVDWSADGSIVSWISDGDLHWVRIDGMPEPVRVRTPETEEGARLSPDQRHYVYAADVSGRMEVYVRGFPSAEGRWQVSANGGELPAWDRVSNEIYFVRDNVLHAVPVETQRGFRAGKPVVLFDGDDRGVQLFRFTRTTSGFSAFPGGQRFVVARQAGASGNFITVVENWVNDLREPR